jgi:hypothetical protein
LDDRRLWVRSERGRLNAHDPSEFVVGEFKEPSDA